MNGAGDEAGVDQESGQGIDQDTKERRTTGGAGAGVRVGGALRTSLAMTANSVHGMAVVTAVLLAPSADSHIKTATRHTVRKKTLLTRGM